jgi:cytochrome b pre-mRNA-processing protein 3
MPIWPFQPSKADADAARLLAAVTAVSRRTGVFGAGRVPDTLEGRFEVMTLNASLVLFRLRDDPGLTPLSQAFTDQLFRQFDAGLREQGVGDTSVPKRMHAMAGAFYGRLGAYTAALGDRDPAALARAISRNIFGVESHAFAPALAALALATLERQAQAQVDVLFAVQSWPATAE